MTTHYRKLELLEAETIVGAEAEDGSSIRNRLGIELVAQRPLLIDNDILEGDSSGPIKLSLRLQDDIGAAIGQKQADAPFKTTLTAVDALKLGQSLVELAQLHMLEKIKVLEDRSMLQAAAALCVRGEVGELRLIRSTEDHWVGRSDCFNIQYLAKKFVPQQPDTVLVEVINVRLANLPNIHPGPDTPAPLSRYLKDDRDQFIRRLLGGSHAFTNQIKITFKGFSTIEQQLYNGEGC